jgi:hypothetical protein
MRNLIIKDYQEAVLLSKAPTELKDALKTSDRIPRFIENLTAELRGCENAGVNLTRMQIKEVVYNMTDWFLACLEANGKRMAASDAEKARIKAVEQEADQFDKDGNADLTEEFGVKIVDG